MAPSVAAKAVTPGRLNEAESKACGICKPTKKVFPKFREL